MTERRLFAVRLLLVAGLVLTLLLLASLPASYAGPGPDPALLQTPTPTATVGAGPRITLFRAVPDTLVAGESFLLEWRSVNATRGLLFTDGLPNDGPIPPTGSMKFDDVPGDTYGLRLVVQNDAEPPQSAEATLIVDVAQQAGLVIVDDEDADFVRHGNPDFWWEGDVGYGNHMVWTYVNGDVISNWIEWRPALPACGDYAVSAFIPRQNATSREARYEVYFVPPSGVALTDESPRVVVVNQSTYANEWVPLGTYRLQPDQDDYLRLTDATGEDPNSLRQIAFDAVRWQLETRCPTRLFLPLLRRASP